MHALAEKKCENHLRKYCQDKIQDNLVLFRPEEEGCENHLRKYCQDKIQDNLVLFRPEEQGGVKTASPRCQDCSGSSNIQRMA